MARERERETLTDILLAATEQKPQARDESGREFLTRLCRAVSSLEDAPYDKLPTEAQDWSQKAIKAVKAERWDDVPSLDGVSAAEDVKPRERERERDDSRERDRDPPRERERDDSRDRSRDDPPPRERERERDNDRGRDDRDRDRGRDDRDRDNRSRDDSRDKDRERERGGRDDRDRDRDSDRGSRERDRERDTPSRDRERDSGKDRDRDSGKDKDKDKDKSEKSEKSDKRSGPPGRPRGTGLTYDVAEIVFRWYPDYKESEILRELDKLKIKYTDEQEKRAIPAAIRSAENYIELARKLNRWKD